MAFLGLTSKSVRKKNPILTPKVSHIKVTEEMSECLEIREGYTFRERNRDIFVFNLAFLYFKPQNGARLPFLVLVNFNIFE